MEKIIYYNNLYDCYKELLTQTQKKYFEDYYFNNLSLGEIADNYDISRNAIFKQIKQAEKKLEEYEEKLEILNKKQCIMDLVKDKKELKEKIEEIL